MMLESFVLHVARDRVVNYGKNFLLKPEGILDIIAEACKQRDIVLENPIKKPEEYIENIIDKSIFYKLGEKICFLHTVLGNKIYDTNKSIKEKREILNNSIKDFNLFFQNLKENYNYNEFKNENSELKDGDYIIENLKVKIEDDKEVQKICKSMENIDMNFYIHYNGLNIYPIISDILIDIVASEYQWNIDKELHQAIITKWEKAKKAQKERKKFPFADFAILELIEKIKYDNLRAFILAEYTRTLNVKKEELRKLIQHVLYYDVANHKNTPKLELNMIDKIPRRPFLLEKTKIVIGGI